MMINKIFFSFFACVGVFFAFMTCAHAQLTAKTVVCGDVQSCNLDTHSCYLCKKTSQTLTGYTGENNIPVYSYSSSESYYCTPKETPPQGKGTCTNMPNGGTETHSSTNDGLIRTTITRNSCKTQYFKQKYEPCYPCEVIIVLFSAFLTAASAAYDATKQAANAILIVASILWIAGFAMKNVSSFTSVEPMKMLQDLFIKFFKIILAFVIINSGLQTILHYSLVPIINTGTDFANTILASTSDYTPDLYNEDFISARAGGGGASSPTGGAGYSGGGSGGGGR